MNHVATDCARRMTAIVAIIGLMLWTGRAAAEITPGQASPQDWPMWRGDAGRTAATTAVLPETLRLRWVRKLEAPAPAWPASQPKIRFDASYEPVVAGKRLFVGSMVADRLTAYDTDTGQELWRFYADGPIRFAPVAWKGNVYFVSDDGCLYCLDAATGQRRWTVRGGPDGRLALGNERLISVWPARGAPVLWEDAESGKGTIYFAASIWPFMGIFIHAVDAENGAIVWTNSGSGSDYAEQQHCGSAFAGVAPQGYLAANADILLVSGGLTVPAAYDRKTGKFLYFRVANRSFSKSAGGCSVCVVDDYFVNGGSMYRLANGDPIVKGPLQVVGDSALVPGKMGLDVLSLTPDGKEERGKDRHGKSEKRFAYSLPRRQTITTDAPLTRFFFQSGGRAYGCGGQGLVGAINLAGTQRPGAAWTGKIDGEVWTMLPADGKLFVVSVAGTISCFDDKPVAAPAVHELPATAALPAAADPASGGYAMLWGLGDDALGRVMALAKDHHVIAIDPDAGKVASLRRKLDDAGLYGRRAHVLVGEPAEMKLPPYLASRLEFGDLAAAGLNKGVEFARKVFHCLRPYGGRAVCAGASAEQAIFKQAVDAAGLAGAKLAAHGGEVELVREGSLPGSAPWTHQYGDVANTVLSRDLLVKPPLGLLWFGGPSNDDTLPRHGSGPTPQVVGGRLFIEGPDALRALDVYTGRLLWQRELKGLGKFYNITSALPQPGAGEIGGNYVSLADGLYVVHDRKCLRLDPATGKTIGEFALPHEAGQNQPYWGYLGVYEDLLIATSTPVAIRGDDKGGKTARKGRNDHADEEDKTEDKDAGVPARVERNVPYASSSAQLVVMDRHTGRVLWSRQAQQVFRHNTIVAGAGKVFCMDAISPAKLDALKRRGEKADGAPVLLALDVRTGNVVWQAQEKVEATWLGYSAEHDVLLAGGSPARFRAKDEVTSIMTAFRGRDGGSLWHREFEYAGTPMLHDATVYTDGAAVELLTGKPRRRANPITGQLTDWSLARNGGCSAPIAGQFMLLFRSAAAGFCDLASDAGTGNWGGFRSSCAANLIPADGVLIAPDYTRTCTCSFQNQSSLALVSMPDVEVWTFQSFDQIVGPVKCVGINFGAPGDWRAPDGTLWLDSPSLGGKGPNLPVQVEGDARYFRRHAMEFQGPASQVTASGVEGAGSIRIGLNGKDEQPYTIRLYFAEPEAAAPGERVFDVLLQGRTALTGFDVFAEAGGQRKGLMKEFRGVSVRDTLTIELRSANGSKRPPVLCGVEAVIEPIAK